MIFKNLTYKKNEKFPVQVYIDYRFNANDI